MTNPVPPPPPSPWPRPYVDVVMERDINDPAPRDTGWCGCCGEYVSLGHHKDDDQLSLAGTETR